MTVLKIKNLTSEPVYISDLGIYIPADETLDASDLFASNRTAPAMSRDIVNMLNEGTIVINDGNVDLDTSNGLAYLNTYSTATHPLFQNDILDDVHIGTLPETSVSQVETALVTIDKPANIKEVFQIGNDGSLAIENANVFPPITEEIGRIFWNTEKQEIFITNDGEWNRLAISRDEMAAIYEFGRNTTLYSGSYLATSWGTSNSSPVILPHDATLTFFCARSSLSYSYTCQIRKLVNDTWTTIASLSAGYNVKSISGDFNIDLVAEDKLSCYISSGRMGNPHCYIEVVWRNT